MTIELDPYDSDYVLEEDRVSVIVCRTEGCAWNSIRFPIRGLTHANIEALCDRCDLPMSMEYGEPHPIIYLDALLEEADAHDGT